MTKESRRRGVVGAQLVVWEGRKGPAVTVPGQAPKKGKNEVKKKTIKNQCPEGEEGREGGEMHTRIEEGSEEEKMQFFSSSDKELRSCI